MNDLTESGLGTIFLSSNSLGVTPSSMQVFQKIFPRVAWVSKSVRGAMIRALVAGEMVNPSTSSLPPCTVASNMSSTFLLLPCSPMISAEVR